MKCTRSTSYFGSSTLELKKPFRALAPWRPFLNSNSRCARRTRSSFPRSWQSSANPDNQKCLIPTSRTFPTLDAVILTSNAIIMVTIMLSPTHDTEEEGFGVIYQNLLHDLLRTRPNHYHLFITDNETTANLCNSESKTGRTSLPSLPQPQDLLCSRLLV